jgi:hypothetical protein
MLVVKICLYHTKGKDSTMAPLDSRVRSALEIEISHCYLQTTTSMKKYYISKVSNCRNYSDEKINISRRQQSRFAFPFSQ